MTYKLYHGNRLYFSWSIAAYLMFNRFGLEGQVKTTIFRPQSETVLRQHGRYPPRSPLKAQS